MAINRRNFNKLMLAATAGIVAGYHTTASSGGETQVAEKHACTGMNACQGQWACKTGYNGCACNNFCLCYGGCSTGVSHSYK